MSTVTKEWLQQAINDYESVRDEIPFGLDDYQGNILAALRIALASLEAEAVAWTSEEALAEVCCDETGMIGPQYMVGNVPLYLHAQHAPVVPDEVNLAIENLKQKLVECNRYNYCSDAVKRVEDSFRAAMLNQGNNHG